LRIACVAISPRVRKDALAFSVVATLSNKPTLTAADFLIVA
jgi:hypothetical protein